MTAETTAIPLLRTKLHRPALPENLVPRDPLIEKLEQGLSNSLTLVTAPAGYGKSTAVSHQMEVCARPQAWLSIDPNDNDLRIFVRYIVEAVHTLSPTACRRTQALLDTANLPPLSVLATTLINELDSVAQEFILVLDDFHLIKSESVLDLIINLLR